jgi:hypothetical protein
VDGLEAEFSCVYGIVVSVGAGPKRITQRRREAQSTTRLNFVGQNTKTKFASGPPRVEAAYRFVLRDAVW